MSASLTPRELQVLRLAARDEPNKRIASRLGISIKTVECYMNRVMQKTGAHTRCKLAHYALHFGYVRNLFEGVEG